MTDLFNFCRDFCFFIYNTPLVWEGKERFMFKDIVWNIRNRDTNAFKTIKFDSGSIDMTGWQGRIPMLPSGAFYRVLMYNRNNASILNQTYPTAAYNDESGFVDYERNFLVHFQTYVYVSNYKH